MTTATPAIDRLLNGCLEVGGCWVFTGLRDRKGYARIRSDGKSQQLGHRVSYEFFIAPIPSGLTFDHLCQNTSCVNPWHGELVPSAVNVARATRGAAVANRAKTHCLRGHPFDAANTYIIRPTGHAPERRCKECQRQRSTHQHKKGLS